MKTELQKYKDFALGMDGWFTMAQLHDAANSIMTDPDKHYWRVQNSITMQRDKFNMRRVGRGPALYHAKTIPG